MASFDGSIAPLEDRSEDEVEDRQAHERAERTPDDPEKTVGDRGAWNSNSGSCVVSMRVCDTCKKLKVYGFVFGRAYPTTPTRPTHPPWSTAMRVLRARR